MMCSKDSDQTSQAESSVVVYEENGGFAGICLVLLLLVG